MSRPRELTEKERQDLQGWVDYAKENGLTGVYRVLSRWEANMATEQDLEVARQRQASRGY